MVPKAAEKLWCLLRIMPMLIMYNIYLIKLRNCCFSSTPSPRKQVRKVCVVNSGTTERSVVGGYQRLSKYCLLKAEQTPTLKK